MITAAALFATVIAPFDPSAYVPPTPLPAGMQPMTIEERAGKRWRCVGTRDCMPAPETFAGWFGTTGPSQYSVRVEVQALAPATARTDRAWAHKVRLATNDVLDHHHVSFHHARGTLRIWRGARGRIAQSEVQYGGRESEPAWRLARHEERDGWTLHLQIQYAGVADELTRAALRAAFADGPLGAAPPSTKALPLP